MKKEINFSERLRVLLFGSFRFVCQLMQGSGIGKLPYVMDFYRWVMTIFSPPVITVNQFKFFLDKGDSMGLSVKRKHYDDFLSSILIRELKSGNVVLEIGSHVGYYTLLMASLVGNSGRVYAFEPDKTNYGLLFKNLQINNVKNVVAENKAVADKKGKMFFMKSSDSQRGKLKPSIRGRLLLPKIDVVSIDNYLKNNKQVDLAKIDVEGAEYRVICGMVKTLKNNPRIKLIIEYCPRQLADFGNNPVELLNLLDMLGFVFYEMNEKDFILLQSNKSEILKNRKTDYITNLYCVRKDVN